ncbi:8-oxo-dGTP diphosphatase MutT [Leeia sp.]|uniref:8-oxo-dGTP diphosphatase MutT n=1 Tax=Leeia sp. TaxID=2884678 RepID=UPI0035AD94C0
MTKRFVHVAAGVIKRPDGTFLLASRPEGKPMAGYWEFPGGKIEAGESAAEALQRELHEELGITVQQALPWVTQNFDYTHARVRLHFFQVEQWQGEPQAHEGQQLAWVSPAHHAVEPVLPANAAILRWLALPDQMQVGSAAAEGVLLPQPPQQSQRGEVCGVLGPQPLQHWSASDLMLQSARPAAVTWCGAQVQLHEQLLHAARLGLDYVWADDSVTLAEIQAWCVDGPPLPLFASTHRFPKGLAAARYIGVHGLLR